MTFGRALLCAVWILSSISGTSTAAQSSGTQVGISDYFRIKRIQELALSADGRFVAFIARWPSLESATGVNRQVRVLDIENGSIEASYPAEDAEALAWVGWSDKVAYLKDQDGVLQLFTTDVSTGETRQITHAGTSVLEYRYAPDGRSVALLTALQTDPTPTLHERLKSSSAALLIDVDETSVYDFLGDQIDFPQRPSGGAIQISMDDASFTVELPGTVREFFWSADSARLSVTVQDDALTEETVGSTVTDVGIVEIASRSYHVLFSAWKSRNSESVVSYTGGEWFPDGQRLVVRRTTITDAWISPRFPEWTVVNVGSPPDESTSHRWHELETYPGDGGAVFYPAADGKLYVENTVRAERGLYAISPAGNEEVELPEASGSSRSKFSFSRDFRRFAFVSESLSRPPEIYLLDREEGARRISRLNAGLANKQWPEWRVLSWESPDGTAVTGWLLEPDGTHPPDGWPLITFVHGGPGHPYKNAFAPYFDSWPYPFELLGTNGIAVFVPNYRGTATFGRDFQSPTRIDGEPVDDIVSGIRHLIGSGVADESRLGIAGQSHGAWLGALVATRAPIFAAGSFAEGSGDLTVNYVQMRGALNEFVHDEIFGTSLFDAPELYVRLSPSMQMEGLQTAMLFEAGALCSALNMLAFPKAANHAGAPNEYYIYPRTGHALKEPALRLESARRNLDWFEYWLLGRRNVGPQAAEQYKRWSAMKRDHRLAE